VLRTIVNGVTIKPNLERKTDSTDTMTMTTDPLDRGSHVLEVRDTSSRDKGKAILTMLIKGVRKIPETMQDQKDGLHRRGASDSESSGRMAHIMLKTHVVNARSKTDGAVDQRDSLLARETFGNEKEDHMVQISLKTRAVSLPRIPDDALPDQKLLPEMQAQHRSADSETGVQTTSRSPSNSGFGFMA
jgi:hypothetical protein